MALTSSNFMPTVHESEFLLLLRMNNIPPHTCAFSHTCSPGDPGLLLKGSYKPWCCEHTGIDPHLSEALLLLLWKQNCWITFINEIGEVSEKLRPLPDVAWLIGSTISIHTHASRFHTKWLSDPVLGCLRCETDSQHGRSGKTI